MSFMKEFLPLNLHIYGVFTLKCGYVTGAFKLDACIDVYSNYDNVHVRVLIIIDLHSCVICVAWYDRKTGVCNSSACIRSRGVLIEMGTPLCILHNEYSHVSLSLPPIMSCALPCAFNFLLFCSRVIFALSALLTCCIGEF